MSICLNKNSQAVKNLIAKVGEEQANAMVGAVSNNILPMIKVNGKLVVDEQYKALKEQYGDAVKAWDEYLKLYDDSKQTTSTETTIPKEEFKVTSPTQRALESTIARLTKRVNELEAKKVRVSPKDKQVIVQLNELYDNAKYFQGLYEFSNNATEGLDSGMNDLREVLDKIKNGDINDVIGLTKIVKDAYRYYSGLKPIIEGVKSEFTDTFKSEVEAEFKVSGVIDINVTELLKELENNLNAIKIKIEDSANLYNQVSAPLFAKFLQPFAEGSGLVHADLVNQLMVAEDDISFFDRWLFSMADSTDTILRLVNEAVGIAKEKSRITTIDIKQDLLAWQEELFAAGYKNYDWAYDKTDGKFNGFLIDKYKWDIFMKARAEFHDNLNKEFKIDPDIAPKDQLEDKVYSKYKAKITTWYQANTRKNVENYASLLEEKRLDLGEEDFQAWLRENEVHTEYGTFYDTKNIIPDSKKSFVVPTDKYLNKEFTNLSAAQLKFYNRITGLKEQLDSYLPASRRSRLTAPQLRKDFVEKAKSIKNLKEAKRVAKDLYEDYDAVDQYDRGGDAAFVLTTTEGKPVDLLPLKFIDRMKDPHHHLSRDIVGGLSIFASMANDYNELSQILDVLEMGKDVVMRRDIKKKTASGKVATEAMKFMGKRIETPIVTPGETSLAYQRLDDYFQMVVYGKYKKDINKTLFGKDREKLIDLLGRYSSINGLALNLFAGISNVGFGNISIRIEAAAAQFFGHKSLAKGSAKYWGNLGNTLANVGKNYQKDKLSLWIQYFNTLQDFESELHEIDSLRKSRVSKLFRSSTMFFINNLGEHYMQTRLSLALSEEVKLKDKNGKSLSLFDAFMVKDGKLVIREGVTKEDGSKWTQNDTIAFIRKQNFINKKLHGIYNYVDRNALQQYALGRLALMFKKFIVPGLIRRYQKGQYSFEGKTHTEGYYNTTFKFFQQYFKEMKQQQYSMIKSWKTLEPWQKANIKRFSTELLFMLGTAILAAFVFDEDEDKDNWALNFSAYQVNRLFTELGFYNPVFTVTEGLKLMKTPIASVNTVQDVYNFANSLMPWSWGDEPISRGRFEGWHQWQKRGFGLIPGLHQAYDLLSPEEKLKYFTFTK